MTEPFHLRAKALVSRLKLRRCGLGIRKCRGWILLVALLLPSMALGERLKLPGGLEVRWKRDGGDDVEVRRGTTKVLLRRGETRYPDVTPQTDVEMARDGKTLVVTFDGNCAQGDTQRHPLAELEALLEDAAATALLRAHKAHEAVAGFQRALALWSKNDDFVLNLAEALVLDGQRDEAQRALQPAIQRAPLAVYWRFRDDPVLGDAPALVALRSPIKGTARGFPAIQPERGWVATMPTIDGGGSDDPADVPASPGQIVNLDGVVLLGSADQRLLEELGFDAPLDESVAIDDPDYDQEAHPKVAWRSKFRKARIGAVCSTEGVFRLVSRDKVIGQGSCDGDKSDGAAWLLQGALVTMTRLNVGCGCGGYEGEDYNVSRLGPAGAPTLQALFEDAAAGRLLRAGKPHEAAAGFARAVTLGGTRGDLARHLAQALVADGRPQEAVTALAALAPLERYYSVVSQPGLLSLQDAPEIAALRAARPGTATSWPALDAARGLVARRHDELDGDRSRYSSTLRFLTVDSAKTVFEVPLVERDETEGCKGKVRNACIIKASQSTVQRRLEIARRLLKDLGFAPPNKSLQKRSSL